MQVTKERKGNKLYTVMYSTVENSIWRFLKKLELPFYPAILLLGMQLKKKNKNTCSKRYMHPSSHRIIIYNCQDNGAT